MHKNKSKGIGVVYIREQCKARGNDFEKRLLAQLTPEEKEVYAKTLPLSWTLTEISLQIFYKAAALLYPGQPDALVKLGYDMQKNDLKGIYKVIIRIPKPAFVIERASVLWSLYSKKGRAWVDRRSDSMMDLYIGEYPDLSEIYRKIIEGAILCIMDILQLEEASIQRQDYSEAKQAWHWMIHWKE